RAGLGLGEGLAAPVVVLVRESPEIGEDAAPARERSREEPRRRRPVGAAVDELAGVGQAEAVRTVEGRLEPAIAGGLDRRARVAPLGGARRLARGARRPARGRGPGGLAARSGQEAAEPAGRRDAPAPRGEEALDARDLGAEDVAGDDRGAEGAVG